MADMLRTGLAWLAGQMMTHASRTVTIRRKAQQATGVSASIGATLLKLEQDGQLWMQWTDRDYLIQASAYVINGVVTEPEAGDLIEDDTDGRVYVVGAPTGEAPWRYSDPHRQLLRIHTKDLGAL